LGTYLVKVEVKLKRGYLDPEGKTVQHSLVDLGYRVQKVGTAKVYEVELSAGSPQEAKKNAEEMCKRLLANPVKDDYSITIQELR
jgi:phosphoribosylformylglycinamidine synthase